MSSSEIELRVFNAADRVEDELLARARASGGAGLGLGLHTLGQLERALHVAAGLIVVDPLAELLLVSAVAPAAARGTALEASAGEPGFARSFLSFYRAAREGGLEGATLARAMSRLGGLAARRGAALARVAVAYEDELGARGVADSPGARLRLIERLPGCALPLDLDRAARVVIEDVIDWPPARTQLIGALARRCRQLEVRLPELDGRPGVASAMVALEQALAAGAPAAQLAFKRYDGGALAGFHRRLFDPAAPVPASPPVQVIEAEDGGGELWAAVEAVRRRLEQGVAPDDICVATRGYSGLRAQLVHAFKRAGIPVLDRLGEPAIEAPPCGLALSLLDLNQRDFPRDRLVDLMRSRYVDGAVPARGEAPAIASAEVGELLREAGVHHQRGSGYVAALAAVAARLGDAAGEADRSKAERARRVSAWLGPWLSSLELPAEARLAEHARALATSLEAIGVRRRCRALEHVREEPFAAVDQAAAAALERDQAALRALAGALEGLVVAARAIGRTQLPITRFEFARLLAETLAPIALRRRGPRGGEVRLMEAAELVGRRFPHLVLVGVVDGRFPLHRAPDPLFDDEDGAALNRALGLRIFPPRLEAEPLHFALACMAARTSLTVTCARSNHAGDRLVRSRFVDEALAAAAQSEPLVQPAAITPAAHRCASSTQLLTRAALLVAGAPPAPGEPRADAVLAWIDSDLLLRARLRAARARAAPPSGRLSTPAALGAIGGWLERRASGFGAVAWAASASALDDYASCPFRFLARRQLELDEPCAVDDDLDGRERGTLLHAVVTESWRALGDEGLLPLAGGARATREQAVAMAACERVLGTWLKQQRALPPALWALERERAHTAVGRLLEAERRERLGGVPAAIEASFGSYQEPPLLLPAPDSSAAIAVRGRVDRIDRALTGELRVIDYKSGGVSDRLKSAEIGRTQFQLAIYAAWARQRFAAPADACYRSLQDGDCSRRLSQALANGALDALLELDPAARAARRGDAPVLPAAGALDLPEEAPRNLADTAWAFLHAIRQGRFDVRPHDVREACRFCAFATVCRIDKLEPEDP